MPFSKPVVVIDNGSFNIKAGFACDNHPVSIFRTTVGRPKYLKGTYGKVPYQVYIGDDAVERCDELELSYPVQNGKITNWDNMERIWHHVFYKELKSAPEERAVLLSCAPATTIADKVKCCEIFFESLNTPALCVKPQSMLALFGSGCTTGLSVDFGSDITEIDPVYEGGSIPYANMTTGYAGAQVFDFIKDSIAKRGINLGENADDIISDIRDRYVYVSEDCTGPLNEWDYERRFKLPDGGDINVADEAFMAGEMYFQPDLVMGEKTNYWSIQEALVTAVKKCDSELQSELYDAIVAHGGMTFMPGLNKRLVKEIEYIINRPVNIIDSKEAYAVAWLGGAIFAGILDARKVWVTKKQFEEQGERIVRNRF